MKNVCLVELYEIIPNRLVFALYHLQVQIFQSRSVFGRCCYFNFAINYWSFKIKHVHYLVSWFASYRVSHEQKMNWHNILHLDSKYTVYSGYQGTWILLKMFKVFWQCFLEDFKFVFIHGFDDELLVVREKEKRAWLTLRFSSVESLVSVSLGAQRQLDHVFVNIVHFSDLVENQRGILKDCDFFVDCQNSLSTEIFKSLLLYLLRTHAECTFTAFQKLSNCTIFTNLVCNKVFIFCLVPHFRVLNFNTIKSLDSEFNALSIIFLFDLDTWEPLDAL